VLVKCAFVCGMVSDQYNVTSPASLAYLPRDALVRARACVCEWLNIAQIMHGMMNGIADCFAKVTCCVNHILLTCITHRR
jgi:hypothetical protein